MSPVERAALCLLTALCGCAHFTPPAQTTGVFFDSTGKVVSETQLIERLNAARFTLVGEAHDNTCDHEQERKVIELASRGTPFAVGLEMMTFEQQTALDLYSQGKLDLAALPAVLDWKTVWGFPFEAYAPLFEAARTAGAPMIGLNAPKAVVQAVRASGLDGVTAEQRVQVTPEIIPPAPEQEALLREAMSQHRRPGKTPVEEMADWNRFVRVQSFWDSQMAWTAAKAGRELGRRVVLIAGGGHVEHGHGIALRLRTFAPKANTLAIMPWRGEAFDPTEADLFFFCPETKEATSAMVAPWTKPSSTSSPPTP